MMTQTDESNIKKKAISKFPLARFFTLGGISLAILAAVVSYGLKKANFLIGFSSDAHYGTFAVQSAVSAFCLSPLPSMLASRSEIDVEKAGGNFTFSDHGDIENDDYTKSSIYSLLYSLYGSTGVVNSERGVPYQFTFNTWGIAPENVDQYGPEDPQRMGKTAYHGLVNFSAVNNYLEVVDSPFIVEIGCGTGAGANLISKEIIPKSNYLALDMQRAAIDTCISLHKKCSGKLNQECEPNPNLDCGLTSGGIGANNASLPVEDESVDFVLISEAHIADIEIGSEEIAIFREIQRVLKPGGLFLWGNALPTRVWPDAIKSLDSFGMKLEESINHTKSAIRARDLDYDRVEAYVEQVFARFPIFRIMSQCRKVSERLLMNFYRHPGTALYLKMTTGVDSYMHLAFRKT